MGSNKMTRSARILLIVAIVLFAVGGIAAYQADTAWKVHDYWLAWSQACRSPVLWKGQDAIEWFH
jgi:ABC-type glycerol-3-phosphate transport system substrate-binding protein